MSVKRIKRIDYKTRSMKGLMLRKDKAELTKLSPIERRELLNRIVELEIRIERLEKSVSVLRDRIFQKGR